MRPADGTFDWQGYDLAYSDFGSGEKTLVLMHGLLMNRHMFDRLAPEMASRGYRVITIDTLGHGASDRPDDMRLYNMPAFGDQIAALIDHLELDRPVVGGTSLGANAALEFGHAHAGKARGLLVEMPVLDNALLGAALAFTPVLLSLRFGQPVLRPLSALLRRVPRTNQLLDIGFDWLRQDPGPSRAVLEGILFHRTAPPHSERVRIAEPALVIGHPSDPLHPFSDAGMLVEEMENARLVDANSILEWRLSPRRLDDILDGFLREAYA
ncbi:MAG: alpha/beta hydrolase, partial [Actinomycetota bacterium]|nr:alpha/beta hydrolase [Actinomycetota bacterium]